MQKYNLRMTFHAEVVGHRVLSLAMIYVKRFMKGMQNLKLLTWMY
jgi:hypothetical protein